jgi:hypothetical protein
LFLFLQPCLRHFFFIGLDVLRIERAFERDLWNVTDTSPRTVT